MSTLIQMSKHAYRLSLKYKDGYFVPLNTSRFKTVEFGSANECTLADMQWKYPNCEILNVTKIK